MGSPQPPRPIMLMHSWLPDQALTICFTIIMCTSVSKLLLEKAACCSESFQSLQQLTHSETLHWQLLQEEQLINFQFCTDIIKCQYGKYELNIGTEFIGLISLGVRAENPALLF